MRHVSSIVNHWAHGRSNIQLHVMAMAQANDWAIGDTGQSTSASEVWWWKPSRVRMSRIARQLDFRNYWGDPPPLIRQCFETAHGTKHTFQWLTSGDRSDQATLPCLHVP